MSRLELDYPDTYYMILNHKGGTKGVVLIDVVARKSSINLEIMNENLYITWDGLPTGVKDYDIDSKELREVQLYESYEHNDNYSANIVEDAYLNEIEAYFSQIMEGTVPIYDFGKDQKVLDVMDDMEKDI